MEAFSRPATELAYRLGFPIHLGTPSPAVLKRSVYAWSTDSKTHLATMMARGTALVRPTYDGLLLTDTKDALLNESDLYGPFDRLAYMDGNHVWELTRPSWTWCVNNQMKHPVTKKCIPISIQSIMTDRIKLAESIGLPNAAPISELLTEIHPKEKQEVEPSVFRIFRGEAERPTRVPPFGMELLMRRAMQRGIIATIPNEPHDLLGDEVPPILTDSSTLDQVYPWDEDERSQP